MPRIFKKIICILLVLCLSCFLLSCYIQKSVSNKHLIEEYSDSSSYTEFYAKLHEWHFDEAGNVIISVYIPVDYDKLSGWKPEYAFEAKILLKNSFDEATSNGLNLKTDETYFFTSIPQYYKDHLRLPIVSIKEYPSGTVYLDFEKGKQNWLNYINNTYPNGFSWKYRL